MGDTTRAEEHPDTAAPHERDPASRVVTYCHGCGGHVGVAGSLGEHCHDETHAYETEHWSRDDARFWETYYAREAQRQRVQEAAEAERLATPLLSRLRASGVRPASDGIMSIHPTDWRDAHDAADVIDELLALATTLAEGDDAARDAARGRLAALRTTLGVADATSA